MDGFENVFEVLTDNRVLICNRCQYAVVPLQIEQHLRQHHRQLSLEQSRELADERRCRHCSRRYLHYRLSGPRKNKSATVRYETSVRVNGCLQS